HGKNQAGDPVRSRETRTPADPVQADEGCRGRGGEGISLPDQAARDEQVRRPRRDRSSAGPAAERERLAGQVGSRTRTGRTADRILIALGAQLVCATTLFAQAMVPPKGEGSISITYQNYYVIGHFDVAGHENRNGGTHSKAVVTEIDYAVTDTVGVSVSLPFIASKYTGGKSYFVGP